MFRDHLPLKPIPHPIPPIRGTWHTAHGLYWLRENPWLRASVGWNTSCLQSVEYNGQLSRKRRWSLYDKYAGIHIIQCLLLLHRLGGINHRLTMFTDGRESEDVYASAKRLIFPYSPHISHKKFDKSEKSADHHRSALVMWQGSSTWHNSLL